MKQPLALTLGEPAGIGPDLCVELANRIDCDDLLIIGDRAVIEARAQALGKSIDRLRIEHIAFPAPVVPGQLNPANSATVVDILKHAAQGCLAGTYAALVTCPVHKGVINDAGIAFSGHTEFFAEQTGGYPVMLLACPGLRVALVTTHLPLAQVPAAITAERLDAVLTVLHQDMHKGFGIRNPRLLVCGLNPHAGESGHLGREEIDVISPTLAKLRAQGIQCIGPLAADTAFAPHQLNQADVIVAMYHDQGLPVLKARGFGEAVNVTLGLPIIRTSVDHGTALELAGTGKADVGSLIAAIETARQMLDHAA